MSDVGHGASFGAKACDVLVRFVLQAVGRKCPGLPALIIYLLSC